MARVTIEDCLPRVEDRFELVILSSLRAKDISKGSAVMIESDKNEKSTILALREIASGALDSSYFDAKSSKDLPNNTNVEKPNYIKQTYTKQKLIYTDENPDGSEY